MKRPVFLFLALVLATAAWGQEAWEGQAFQAERGVLPETGLYAAANDFPRNTFLEVSLPRTGKTVLVEVLKRNIEGIDGPVLLLSSEAASGLGLQRGESAQVAVRVSSDLRSLESTLAEERRSNPDPELNPAAVTTDTPVPSTNAIPEPLAPVVETPRVIDTPVEVVPETTSVVETPALPENAFIEQPEVVASPQPAAPEIIPDVTIQPRTPALEPGPETANQQGFREPREVGPVVPVPETAPITAIRPEFVDVPEGREPAQAIAETPRIRDPNIPLVAPNPPGDEREPDVARSSPSARQPSVASATFPILAATPPASGETPRVSPEPYPLPRVTSLPDSPPAPNTFPEVRPVAVSPAALVPMDTTALSVLPELRESAVVSPSSRIPPNARVADLPGMSDLPRYVQAAVPSSSGAVADLPQHGESPRFVEPSLPSAIAVADLPQHGETPRYIDPALPPGMSIADLPRLSDSPRYVDPALPPGSEVADLPATTEAPRYVETNRPPLGEIADLPAAGDRPRYVDNPETLPQRDIVVVAPEVEERPSVGPEPAVVATAEPPLVTPAQPQRQQGGLTAVTQRTDGTGRRYVSRPAKPEGDILGDIPVVDSLAPGSFYVQLGTYRDEASLFGALDRIRTYVPLTVLTSTRGLRLLSGPVTEGQIGLLLRHYQQQGFRDAFVIRPAR